MELKDFVANFAEQFDETDASVFTPATKYHDLEEWSSLIGLSVMAMVDDEYDVMLKGNASVVESIGTVMTEPFVVEKSGVMSVRLSLPSDVTAYDENGNVIASVAVTVKNLHEILPSAEDSAE